MLIKIVLSFVTLDENDYKPITRVSEVGFFFYDDPHELFALTFLFSHETVSDEVYHIPGEACMNYIYLLLHCCENGREIDLNFHTIVMR